MLSAAHARWRQQLLTTWRMTLWFSHHARSRVYDINLILVCFGDFYRGSLACLSVNVILLFQLTMNRHIAVGRDSAVGTATCYSLEVSWMECHWGGGDFPHYPDRSWGPPSLLYNEYRFIQGGKSAGTWRWLSTTSSADVK